MKTFPSPIAGWESDFPRMEEGVWLPSTSLTPTASAELISRAQPGNVAVNQRGDRGGDLKNPHHPRPGFVTRKCLISH